MGVYKRDSETMRAIALLPRAKPSLRSGGRGGWKLRGERVALGVSQVAIASELGIPPALLSMLEHEMVRLPRGFMQEYRAALLTLTERTDDD